MSELTGDLGSQVREERSVAGFTRVVLDGIGGIHIEQGDRDSLTIEAPERLIDWIEAQVRGDTLRLSMRDRLRLHDVGKLRIRYEISMRQIDELAINGAGSISCSRVRARDLALRIDGAGNITAPEIVAASLNLRIDGAGKMEIGRPGASRIRIQIDGAGKIALNDVVGDALDAHLDGTGSVAARGKTGDLDVRLNGTGRLRLEELESERASVRIDGTGKADVWARDSLDVRINGLGKVRFRGHPEVTAKTGGFGRITRIEDT